LQVCHLWFCWPIASDKSDRKSFGVNSFGQIKLPEKLRAGELLVEGTHVRAEQMVIFFYASNVRKVC